MPLEADTLCQSTFTASCESEVKTNYCRSVIACTVTRFIYSGCSCKRRNTSTELVYT